MSSRGELVALTVRQMEAVRADKEIYFKTLEANRYTYPMMLCDEPLTQPLELNNAFDLFRVMQETLDQHRGELGQKMLEDWSLFSGDEIDEVPDPYLMGEPERLRSPEGTKKFAQILDSITLDELLELFDHYDLVSGLHDMDFYYLPDGQSDEEIEAEMVADLEHYFPALQDYVREAAAAGQGLLSWVG
jgi:hypothetical protein